MQLITKAVTILVMQGFCKKCVTDHQELKRKLPKTPSNYGLPVFVSTENYS